MFKFIDKMPNWLYMTCLVLVVTFVLGVGLSVFNTPSVNVGTNNGTVVKPDIPNDTETSDEPEYEFSGQLLKKIDLSKNYYNSSYTPLYSDFMSSSNGSCVSTETKNGWFNCNFDYSESNSIIESGGSLFAFGVVPQEDPCLMSFDYEYFTVDMDISIDNVHEIFSFYSLVTDNDKEYCTSTFRLWGQMNEEGSKIRFWSTESTSNNILYEINDDYFHLTAIYEIDLNKLEASYVHFYINGVYVCSGNPFYGTPTRYCTFRTHFAEDSYTSSGTYSVKNIEFYVFEDPNHESMLAKAVNDKTNLKYCPDSVLYEGK